MHHLRHVPLLLLSCFISVHSIIYFLSSVFSVYLISPLKRTHDQNKFCCWSVFNSWLQPLRFSESRCNRHRWVRAIWELHSSHWVVSWDFVFLFLQPETADRHTYRLTRLQPCPLTHTNIHSYLLPWLLPLTKSASKEQGRIRHRVKRQLYKLIMYST